jgi:LPS-assembly lipoprotein
MMRKLVLGLACLSLAGCGFTPVYGSGGNGSKISIDEIEGRTGHFLRQELVRQVGGGVPGFPGESRLEVKLAESINRLSFAPDQAASRSDYNVTANFTLHGPNDAQSITGTVRDAVSFNFADAAYADIAAQEAAQQRIATLLARSIREKLVIEAGHPKTPGTPPAPLAAPPPPTGARPPQK